MNFRLPIANCQFMQSLKFSGQKAIGNCQLAIGNEVGVL